MFTSPIGGWGPPGGGEPSGIDFREGRHWWVVASPSAPSFRYGRSASASSAALFHRRAGSFSRHFRMIASMPRGSAGFNEHGKGHGSLRIAAKSSGGVGDWNGNVPVSIRNRMTPSDQMSERPST